MGHKSAACHVSATAPPQNSRSRRIARSLLRRGLTAGNGHHAALPNYTFDATPADMIRGKGQEPDEERGGVVQREGPELAAENFVPDTPNAYSPGHRRTQNQVGKQIHCRGPRRWRNDCGKQNPRESLRKKKPDVGQWPAQSHCPRPAHLMVPEAAKCLSGIHSPDGFSGKDNLAARFDNAVANLIVIPECIRNCLEPAHFPEPFPGRRDGSSEGKSNSFHPLGHQYAGEKIARGANCFDLRT